MIRKIFILVMTLVLFLSGIMVVLNDFYAEATYRGDDGTIGKSIGLDLDYLWNVTYTLSRVVHDVYSDSEIRKGRAFGTKGDNWTADYLWDKMQNELELENVAKIPIGPINDTNLKGRYYSSRINISGYSLCINNENYTNETNGLPNVIPLNESFVFPSCRPKNMIGSLTDNFTFEDTDDIRIYHTDNKYWPYFGVVSNVFKRMTGEKISNAGLVIGNATYINSNEELPVTQDDMVFLIDEDENCDDKLENVTNASAVILIKDEFKGTESLIAPTCSFPVVRTMSNEDNLSSILDIIKNETVMVDNAIYNDTLTFTYELSDCTYWPRYNFTCLGRVHKAGEDSDEPDYSDWRIKTIGLRFLSNRNNIFPFNKFKCKGVILNDTYKETHYMNNYNPRLFDSGWFRMYYMYGAPALPMFTVNGSVGAWLYNHTGESNTTITGYVDQEYLKERHWPTDDPDQWTAGTKAYNVEGEINTKNSPGDARICISNRYDGWWLEAPFDSGAGAGVVLGIAKYLTDYNITPKYNLTFLFTTGEELLYRGAQHYSDSHNNTNFTYFIGFDQLGIDYPDTTLEIFYKEGDTETRNICENLSIQTEYEKERTNYSLDFSISSILVGAEDIVWNTREEKIEDGGIHSNFPCKTICFVKDGAKTNPYRHRAGNNYRDGDSMKNMNRSDLNVTFELAWNITKYFAVWPDCWFYSSFMNIVDSDDDDNLKDTVTVNFDSKSILPHDFVMVNLSLLGPYTPSDYSDNVVLSEYLNFSVNRSQTSKSINITLPEGKSPGVYKYRIDLYNSTGRINDIVGIGGNNVNITEYSGFFFLYPYNTSYNIPKIENITANPDPVGFGQNVTINADVTSNVSGIDKVTVNISYPDDTYASFNMTNTVGDTYEYVFTDSWQNGQYDYVIWTKDVNGNESGSSQHTFNVSAQATISVCTIKDSYGSNEIVNLTDPPCSSYAVGYELLDDGKVLHIWNNLDNYYFDTDSGIQLTNHYSEYWSHNVLMLGYYNNDQWNLIYRTDELSGFNKDIESDNETYVNATLWKDLNYEGYDFRLAIRYHLGINDNELTVIPYIKNIDDEDIPYDLGFAWEIKDIQIDMTEENDYIDIDGTTYYLNTSGLDETYTNLDIPSFYIKEDTGVDESESLYLRWDENLNYKVQVKSRSGQYNAPVTLGIKIGTLDVGQEKSTEMFWHDASEVIYYFNDYDTMLAWATNPAYMVDCNTSNYASTTIDRDMEKLNINLESSADKGAISKVEIRAFGKRSGGGMFPPVIILNAVGGLDVFTPTTTGAWSSWYDITNKPNAPDPWTWNDIDNLIVDVEASVRPAYTLYCSKVDVRVTYNPNPVISNPYPPSGSKGITITPVLNITVSDPEGDTMNITWLSNSSGSWQIFGRNNSVSNGTYHQTFSNATVNGQWWYWKVNVSDGTNTVTSNVFSFYTGYQSKIENTGSTNFTGYLLMQIEFYNTTNSTWILEQVVVNESTPRTINAGSTLALDTIFNQNNVSTSSFTNGNGTYRVYAAFRDPDYDVLVCDDESLLEASYQFTVSSS